MSIWVFLAIVRPAHNANFDSHSSFPFRRMLHRRPPVVARAANGAR
jgi:hypothetical protein